MQKGLPKLMSWVGPSAASRRNFDLSDVECGACGWQFEHFLPVDVVVVKIWNVFLGNLLLWGFAAARYLQCLMQLTALLIGSKGGKQCYGRVSGENWKHGMDWHP